MEQIAPARIRNFVITAHIDHGKSTLADRFLELTGTVEARKMHPQYLDQMGLEQERGITIKMTPVRMRYRQDREEFVLDLIDTPGHVDFAYEVSRALAAVEGVVLLVDATKGIQAQTLANLEFARAQGLAIVPAVNKIDLPQARTDQTKKETAAILGIDAHEVLQVSAKTGNGVLELLSAVVNRVPSPSANSNLPLRALVFDSHYDDFRGVIAHVRVVDGRIQARERLRFLATGAASECIEVGTFRPERRKEEALQAGEIGYVVTGLKDPPMVRIGDTLTHARTNADIPRKSASGLRESAVVRPLPGYREPQSVVYAALFPENADEFEALKDALEKLRLNDAALTTAPEESHALGRGFRCGFLGTLHMEIVAERLRREFGLHLVVTHPSVVLTAILPDGREHFVRTPRDFPAQYKKILEPWVRMEMLVPPEELSSALRIIGETRGMTEDTKTVTALRIVVHATMPLLDVVEEFADRLKSATRGFASFSWQPFGDREGDLARLTCLVAHEEFEAFSQIVPRERAEFHARSLALRLKDAIPPQLFSVAIQVAADGRIMARETIRALRKDVTAPLYGGDFTRKKKLLVKQRKGKKRLEKMGRVHIPPETFLKILRRR